MIQSKLSYLLVIVNGLFSNILFAQQVNKIKITEGTYGLRFCCQPLSAFIVNEDKLIHIESTDTSIRNILLMVNQGIVKEERTSPTQAYTFYMVRPEKTGSLLLSFYNDNDREHPLLIEEKEVPVFSFPEASIAGKKGGDISREELLTAEKVLCTGDYKVEKFKLSVVSNEVNRDFYNPGESLTQNMLNALEQVHAGGKIYLESINARPKTGGQSRQLAPVTFTLTE